MIPGPWNLVHVVTQLELGGAQLVAMRQVQGSRFPGAGRFLLHGPNGLLDAEARGLEGVETIELPALQRDLAPRRDAEALRQLFRALRQLRARRPGERWLVQTHSSKAGILGRLAAWAAGADLVVHTIHGFGHNHTQAPTLRAALLAAEQAVAHVTDGFMAVSHANLRQARREGILGEVPAAVVRCATDLARFTVPLRDRDAVRAELGIEPAQPVVLDVSCLKPQKDPETFVRVAASVLARRPDTTFLLAGDGELRPRVEALVTALRLDGRVRLLGWRRDIPELLHASDLLLLTSLWEGLPQTCLQAMAAGLPVVATAVDGTPEAVRHGDNGVLAAAGDVEALATAVLALLEDPCSRTAMGARGKELVAAFSDAQMLIDLDHFYARLAAGTPSRVRVQHFAAQARYWARALFGAGPSAIMTRSPT